MTSNGMMTSNGGTSNGNGMTSNGGSSNAGMTFSMNGESTSDSTNNNQNGTLYFDDAYCALGDDINSSNVLYVSGIIAFLFTLMF